MLRAARVWAASGVRPPVPALPMTDSLSDWRRVEAVFSEAADLPTEARPAFLDGACRTADGDPDTDLRRKVEDLLDADAPAAAFFEAPPPKRLERVGAWRLVDRVGRGGMGEVWRAERADGRYEQTAAVKLVRAGLAPRLEARFLAERQILARLDHPAIGRLLDGGVAEDGRPWLAMEFVEGEPLTAYCDHHKLSVDDRLELFRSVCDAVQSAHRKLVVHRDLKPSNVLATATPEGPRVKLLDFGIAKLIAEDDPTAPETAPDLRMMTPEYAAPEQVAEGDITTATDVYALGVLLYELLTGRRPHADAGGRHAIEQAILETEPVRPSDAVTHATAGHPATRPPSERAGSGPLRATSPERLRRRLRGDLDRIVMKALQPDPEQRYRGAAELAADLRRHLDGLPVEARAPTVGYRLDRFVRRHRVGVAASVLALVAVLGGAGVAVWQAAEAERASERAERRAQEAEAVAAFLEDVFAAGDSEKASGPEAAAAVAILLDEAQSRAEAVGDDTPEARLAIDRALARAYGAAGRPLDQRRALEATLPRHVAAYGSENERTAEVLWLLADLDRREGRVASARARYAEAVTAARAAARVAPSRTLPLALAGLADVLPDDSLAARERLLHRARTAARRLPDPDLQEADVVDLFAQDWPQDPARAEALFREAAILARRGGDRRRQGDILNNLGLKLEYVRPDDAVTLLRQAVRVLSDTLGADHPQTIIATYNLGAVLTDGAGAPAGGLVHLRRALALQRRVHPEGSTREVGMLYWLGRASLALGELDDAEAALAGAIALGLEFQGENSWRARQARPYYAEALARRGRTTEAAQIYREEIARVRAEGGDPSELEAARDAVLPPQ